MHWVRIAQRSQLNSYVFAPSSVVLAVYNRPGVRWRGQKLWLLTEVVLRPRDGDPVFVVPVWRSFRARERRLGLQVIGVDYQPAAFDISSPIGVSVLRVSHGPARSTSVSAHDAVGPFLDFACT